MNTLTAAEIKLWANYREKHGSLNFANRQDAMLAQLMYVIAKVNGADDVDIYDFHPTQDRPPVEITDIFK